MSFGRTHVSITLCPENDVDEVTEDMLRYARQIDALIPVAKTDL